MVMVDVWMQLRAAYRRAYGSSRRPSGAVLHSSR